MAAEVTKGLNILLHPQFEQMVARMDKLEAFHKDLSGVVAAKEDHEDVMDFKEEFKMQMQKVDDALTMHADKMLSLDETRSHEIRGLSKAAEQKASLANLSHLLDQHQVLCTALSTKAELARVDQLSQSVTALGEEVATKTPSITTEQLGRQVEALADSFARRMDDVLERLNDRCRSLADDIARCAENSHLLELCRRIDALTEDVRHKAENSAVHQISRHHAVLNEDLSQRTEQRRFDQLTRQVRHLSDEVAHKAEHAVTEQALHQIMSLSQAVSLKTEGGQHVALHDQVVKMREEMLAMKSEMSRIDHHARHLETLNSTVSMNSARLKHLALMAAANSGGSLKDALPAYSHLALDSPLKQRGSDLVREASWRSAGHETPRRGGSAGLPSVLPYMQGR
mmetsp:Transcript_15291/g.30053  ORF Transcript_15291/g.30053 Transcript_15291/m.30053 type:complete len:398 (-) Transcript_15291:84-1277(-)|eukprot:CAMPEP_0172888100 /NCGR_PEP_ID=MMETSP1075-20121228/135580_1 /TAXON_ID=2916 /ORGANISM="Ceratium fusus, Strain PA161109" /LENGTH=397 /DNA_ID=CAMNT_0013741909 /DNA_START=15 /DNA_END=1208 /DNA_ORIENTATION=+